MDLTGARWHKSTRSGSNQGACVEVADNLAAAVYVRDTKDCGTGPVLVISRESWRAFVAGIVENG
ncbi:DUF397 domain-containing protein [Micromonospora andamanensis]|uniref:DUF397 domain-containing protein n=1 Tax=Micromonospora andamanensis TaxID=1287068 RepID=UPI001951974C|nr:DUF397 domain-containing protein [Micromonospora andamanensis]GIJ37178.1 DUF397 domain-containing protein [Micromonospora andamanensis]